MKLPDAENAQVDQAKVKEYLLSPDSPRGRMKAAFFGRFGFSRTNWQDLAEALRMHAQKNDVVRSVESIYGRKYTVEGAMETPDGRNPRIRTVWIIEKGRSAPRFITAYRLRTA